MKATGVGGSVSQHDGQSKEHSLTWIIIWPRDLFSAFASGHQRPVALQSCGQRDCVSAFSICVQRSLHFLFFLRDVTVTCATVTSCCTGMTYLAVCLS